MRAGSRPIALLALTVMLGCDDPLRPRPAPVEARLAVFALLDPDKPTLPVLVQQPHGALLDFAAVAVSGGATLATSTPTAPSDVNGLLAELEPCVFHYRQQEPLNSAWLMRCAELSFAPQPGATYEVSVSSAGRPTARGSTTVPGDFEIVSHAIQPETSGDIRVEAVWRSSAQAHRYIVSLVGFQTGQPIKCVPDTDCHDRWFVVTQDTALSTVIPARYFADADREFLPYALAVYAVSRELYGYMMTGVTSDFFPVPPAQNVAGGFGGVGSWVRRVAQTHRGITMQRVRGGLRITNNTGGPSEYEVTVFHSPSEFASCHFTAPACPVLANGASVTVLESEIKGLSRFSLVINLFAWRDPDPLIFIPIYFY